MDVFDVEQQRDTLILIPQMDLNEFEFDRIEESGAEVFQQLDAARAKNVVVDFHRTDYYGSTAIAFFIKLWKRVRSAGGNMAFCNVSAHEKEILELTHLNTLWKVSETRDEALKAVNQ